MKLVLKNPKISRAIIMKGTKKAVVGIIIDAIERMMLQFKMYGSGFSVL